MSLLHEWGEKVNRHRQEGGRVMLAGDFAHGLEEAQLQRDRFFADHGGGLDHPFRRLKFAFGIDDLGAALALGFRLLGHRASHGVGQRHILHFDGRDFAAPRPGPFAPSNLTSLKMTPRSYSRRMRIACGKMIAARMRSGTVKAPRPNNLRTMSSMVSLGVGVECSSCLFWFYLQSEPFNANYFRHLARFNGSVADCIPIFS